MFLQSLTSKSDEPKLPNFVVPPSIKDFKWRDDIFVDRLKKRMSVELQRHSHFGSLDPGLYPKDFIPEGDEITDDYLPQECRGRLWLKFAYDSHEECLAIGLVKLRFVPRRLDDTAPDVVVNFTVLPNERRQYQTRVYEATTDRDFTDDDECFLFQVPKQCHSEWQLRVRLVDNSNKGSKTASPPIGAAIVQLAPIIDALYDDSNDNKPSSHFNVTVRCIDLLDATGENGDQITTATTSGKSQNDTKTPNSTPPTLSSPVNSGKLVRKFMAMNTALQQQLASAVRNNSHLHQNHSGIMQMTFCFSSSANRLSISVHEFTFACQPNEETGADQKATDEEHQGLEAFAKLSLFEHGNKELKSKRTRTVKVEKIALNSNSNSSNGGGSNGGGTNTIKAVTTGNSATTTKANTVGEDEKSEHSIRFIELVVFKDLPQAEHLLNNCGLRIQVVKTSLCSRDKPICRNFLGSAIFCRGKELTMWEEIINNKLGEPVAFSIRLNPVFDED